MNTINKWKPWIPWNSLTAGFEKGIRLVVFIIFEMGHNCCKGCRPPLFCWHHWAGFGIILHTVKNHWVLGVVGPGRIMECAYEEILDSVSTHRWGPWCYLSQSHFTVSRVTASPARAVLWKCGFGNTPRVCCASFTQITRSQSHCECLGSHRQRLPLRSYRQLPYRHCPGNYSVGVIALCRRTTVNGGIASICQTGGIN